MGGLHVGRVIDEHREHFERGDFLVRNVIGADRELGALAVSDVVPVGTTVQFHLRDAQTADEDLHLMLDGRQADGALVFTCNGRGTRMFEQPTTTWGCCRTGSAPCRRWGSFRRARSVRSAGVTSCTASPRPWLC